MCEILTCCLASSTTCGSTLSVSVSDVAYIYIYIHVYTHT